MLTLRLLTSAPLAATLAHAGVPTNQANTMFAPILRTSGPAPARFASSMTFTA